MTGALKGAMYTALIAGTVLGGGYLVDRKVNLGIKENIAEYLIDNPADAAGLYMKELNKSKNKTQYQNQISGMIVKSGKYLDDRTKILTADELVRMSSQDIQESYLELKVKQLPEEKKLKIAENTLKTLSMENVFYIIDTQPDSVQNGIVKHVVGNRISGFFEDAKKGIKRAYDSTIGKLDKE